MKKALLLFFFFVLGLAIGMGWLPIDWAHGGWYIAGGLLVLLIWVLDKALPRWNP